MLYQNLQIGTTIAHFDRIRKYQISKLEKFYKLTQNKFKD